MTPAAPTDDEIRLLVNATEEQIARFEREMSKQPETPIERVRILAFELAELRVRRAVLRALATPEAWRAFVRILDGGQMTAFGKGTAFECGPYREGGVWLEFVTAGQPTVTIALSIQAAFALAQLVTRAAVRGEASRSGQPEPFPHEIAQQTRTEPT